MLDELARVLTLRSIGQLRRYVAEFEQDFASAVGARHAVGANSGTSALYFALRALDIGPGDDVITVANSWVTTVTAIRETGAHCRFADVSPETGVMAPEALEAAINERTKAIVPVHMYGNPVDMEAVCKTARAHGIHLIEDACQGIGASFAGKPAGSWGDIGCFSFHVNKLVGAPADGGMVVTNSPELAERVRYLSQPDWSACLGPAQVRVPSRLPPLAVPVLRGKLRNLDREVARRCSQFELYRKGFAALPLTRVLRAPAGGHASFRTCVLVSPEAPRFRALAKRLKTSLEPMYKESLAFMRHLAAECPSAELPHTASLLKHHLVLPNGPDVTDHDIGDIITVLTESAGIAGPERERSAPAAPPWRPDLFKRSEPAPRKAIIE